MSKYCLVEIEIDCRLIFDTFIHTAVRTKENKVNMPNKYWRCQLIEKCSGCVQRWRTMFGFSRDHYLQWRFTILFHGPPTPWIYPSLVGLPCTSPLWLSPVALAHGSSGLAVPCNLRVPCTQAFPWHLHLHHHCAPRRSLQCQNRRGECAGPPLKRQSWLLISNVVSNELIECDN